MTRPDDDGPLDDPRDPWPYEWPETQQDDDSGPDEENPDDWRDWQDAGMDW